MTRPVLALALLAATLSSCGSSEDSAGACIAVLEVDGVSYYGHSDPEEPVPTTGTTVDAVVPACNDTGGDPGVSLTDLAASLCNVIRSGCYGDQIV